MTPLISVIIPTYNGEEYLGAALESVRSQYCKELEVVVVDDGSTDGTMRILNNFRRSLPLRVLNPGRLGNWVATTNIGLREARGEWACLLHQDDLWLPGRVGRILPELARAEGAMVLHHSVFIGPRGERLGPWKCPLKQGDIPANRFLERLLVQDFIAIPAPVFRRSAAVDSGGLDESLWLTADWELWLRLGALGPVRFVPETLTAFRVHPESQTIARKLRPGEWEHQLSIVLERHFGRWQAPDKLRREVRRAALASNAINATLAVAARGERVSLARVLRQLIALGPGGWRRYLRDSRIVERIGSRLRVRLLAMTAEKATGG
ncbi:MAG: glycosyltransferase [Acidobacteriaceae bacterium]